MTSADAWQAVHKRLAELGLLIDKTDRSARAVLTKWRGVRAKGMEWLRPPVVPEGYTAERVRFQVFVSPYAEPARVYVGSMVEARVPSGASATGYNVQETNASLMGEIVKALGDGFPIPADYEQRRQLALSLLKDRADDCLREEALLRQVRLRQDVPQGTRIIEPRKIPQSEFEIIYPAAAIKDRKGGTVRVEFMILEDGGISGVRLVDAPQGHQLDAAALGAASLLLYVPAKRDGCAIAVSMTYEVRFRQ